MRLHCFLKAHPTGKNCHMKHTASSSLTWCPGPWLLPWLGWKRSWDPGAEHQLSLGSLQADRGQERPPKTAAKSHSYVLHPAEGAGPTQPCSAPEPEERQPGQEQRQQEAPCVTELPCGETLPSLKPSLQTHTGWGHSTAKPEATHSFWGHHQHR